MKSAHYVCFAQRYKKKVLNVAHFWSVIVQIKPLCEEEFKRPVVQRWQNIYLCK